jgi:tetratricopeptide (TPR) repeat protein
LRKIIFISSLALVLALAKNIFAYESIMEETVCPVCGTTYEAEHVLSMSQFGMRLDMKPLGFTKAPLPLAICPNCHFVQYSDSLSDHEIADLKSFVDSDEYQALAKDNSSYFLLGKIFEHEGRDPMTLAHVYLQASWQVEDKPAKYQTYLALVQKNLESYLSRAEDQDDNWVTAQLLLGEIMRLQGKFEDAGKQFESIKNNDKFKDDLLQQMISFELELINDKDQTPQEIPGN